MLNMFRTLIYPSSGACDFSIVSPQWACVLVSMCVGVSVWLGWGGISVAGFSFQMDVFFGIFPNKSVRNILSTVTICSNFGSLLYTVDTVFSVSVGLARLVAKLRFPFNVFTKINNTT